MKTNQELVFQNEGIAEIVGKEGILYAYAQLALRRLKRALLWLGGLFNRVEMVRQVGPGLAPQRRHEWEKPNYRPPIV